MSITTLDEIDQNRLSADARETLLNIAPRIADGEETKVVASDLGMTPKQVNERMTMLREEMRAQKEGALLPPLKDDEYESLRDSIRDFGQLVPIVVDAVGNPLYDDGNHRLRACLELGLEPWTVQAPHYLLDSARGFGKPWRRAATLAVNATRRQLTPDQRKQVAASELLFDPHASDRSIAARTGVSHPTVAKVRRELQSRGLVRETERRRDVTGRERTYDGGMESVSIREDEGDSDELAVNLDDLPTRVIATESDRHEDLEGKGTYTFTVAIEAVEKLKADWYGPVQIRLVEIEGRGYELWVREL